MRVVLSSPELLFFLVHVEVTLYFDLLIHGVSSNWYPDSIFLVDVPSFFHLGYHAAVEVKTKIHL